MNVRAQIQLLKSQHQFAVNSFDFDQAESIATQIKALQRSINRSKALVKVDLTEQNEKFLSNTHQHNAEVLAKKTEIRAKYQKRQDDMTQKHTQERTELSLQHSIYLDRELSRPIHESDLKLDQSKCFAKAHDYEGARALYKEAMIIKDKVIEERKQKCEKVFKNQLAQLVAKQERELALLKDKQEAELIDFEHKCKKHESVIRNSLIASEVRASMKPREKPVVRNTMNHRKRSFSTAKSATVSNNYYSSLMGRSARFNH